MTTDIFIRSYHKDIPWLKYMLKSVYKNLTGYRKIVLCIPLRDKEAFVEFYDPQYGLTIVYSENYEDDYLGQQVSKLTAHLHTDADVIMYLDSDSIIKRKTDVSEFMKNGKPIIWKTKYTSVGDSGVWKPVTEKVMCRNVQYEYMRRFPFIFFRSSLIGLDDYVRRQHGCPVARYVMKQPYRHFSEFNALGAYCDIAESKRYEIIDTETVDMPESPINQYWSWGGITDQIKSEIEGVLND